MKHLTDEQVAEWATDRYYNAAENANVPTLAAKLATEVQAHRALRPDCPTCEGRGFYTEDSMLVVGVPGGQYPVGPCDDCDETGKMPLDKWVALLVQTLAPLPASLADIALTIPSCSHSDAQEGDCDWLLRAHVRRIDAVLKMAATLVAAR